MHSSSQVCMLVRQTIYNTKKRYLSFSGSIHDLLQDLPRSGQPPKVTAEVEAHMTAIACSESPAGTERWTMSLIRDKLVSLGIVDSLSDETVRLCLKKANSSPGSKNNGALPE